MRSDAGPGGADIGGVGSADHVLRPGDTPYVVALAALDLFPRQLVELVFRWGAEEAWQRVRAGAPGTAAPAEVARAWARRAASIDPVELLEAHRRAEVGVAALGGRTYPEVLVDDPEAPLVLFHRGEPGALDGPSVGIVGTRQASAAGRALAREWSTALSEAGVAVVSGLALGIDAAAHDGALRGPTPPVGVVGSGLDVVYPRRNRTLWDLVAGRGLLCGEHPLGTSARSDHFPARNRIIAGLSDVLLVVESHRRGGSLITASAALTRHRTVLAVPGSVHNPAAEGTNQLLRDGATIALDVDDVLVALDLARSGRRRPVDARPQPDAAGRTVLDAFAWSPARLEMLALRTGQPLLELADVLERLTAQGWLHEAHGWFERVGAPAGQEGRR